MDSQQSHDKFQQKLAHVAENEITPEKMVYGIFWTSKLGRGTCGMDGMEIQNFFFQNHKVPVSLQWFHMEKF